MVCILNIIAGDFRSLGTIFEVTEWNIVQLNYCKTEQVVYILKMTIVLCCAVLCCAVLCCAVLCCAVLCCTVLYCILSRLEHCTTFRSGSKWAHVSCALWIPEVSIGCPEKMEPITKISHIPVGRSTENCFVKGPVL